MEPKAETRATATDTGGKAWREMKPKAEQSGKSLPRFGVRGAGGITER